MFGLDRTFAPGPATGGIRGRPSDRQLSVYLNQSRAAVLLIRAFRNLLPPAPKSWGRRRRRARTHAPARRASYRPPPPRAPPAVTALRRHHQSRQTAIMRRRPTARDRIKCRDALAADTCFGDVSITATTDASIFLCRGCGSRRSCLLVGRSAATYKRTWLSLACRSQRRRRPRRC